jgi:hypothetical protein
MWFYGDYNSRKKNNFEIEEYFPPYSINNHKRKYHITKRKTGH